MVKRYLYYLIIALALTSIAPAMLVGAYAQTRPSPVVSTNASGTIAVTNTFQSIFVAPTPSLPQRLGCTVVNYGTNTMWVFFGAIASATKAASVQLAAGVPAYCQFGGIVLQDQVSITGTSGDAFFAARQ